MKQYSFNKVDLLIDGVPITGFAESNNIITAGRSVNAHNNMFDAKGNMVAATSGNLSGIISFNLLHTSDSHQVLQARAILDQSIGTADNNASFVPWHAIIQDKMGGTLVVATTGNVPKVPSISRGNGINTMQWNIVFEQIHWPTPGTYADSF